MKVLIIACLLLFLIACGAPATVDPHSGTRGLDLTIASFTPHEVYVGQEFTLGIESVNYGSNDLEATLLLGTERGLFSAFEPAQAQLNLEGRETTLQSIGGRELSIFTATIQPIPATEELRTTLIASACHPYRTEFSTTVCIDTDLLNEDRSKPSECPPRVQSTRGGQGAPVAVVSVEPIMRPTQNSIIPSFTFVIRNVDDGSVFAKSALATACTQGITREQSGFIDVISAQLGNDALKCNTAQLKTAESEQNNEFYTETKVTCEGSPISLEQAPYLTAVQLTLEYGYKTSVEHDLVIKQR